MAKDTFKNLVIPGRQRPDGFACGYRVYKDRDNFVVVQAQSASGALEASGLKDPYKIEIESLELIPVLDIQGWEKDGGAKAPETASVVEPPAPTANET